MRATRDELLTCLDSLGIVTRTIEHKAVFTVAESSAVEAQMPGGHTKNLFLKDKKDKLFLVVALNDAPIDLKSLHKRLDCGRLSFGNAVLLEEVLGVTPGSVTPFALINDKGCRVRVILDDEMMKLDRLNFHPLENTATTGIASGDLLRFIQACGHEPSILGIRGSGGA